MNKGSSTPRNPRGGRNRSQSGGKPTGGNQFGARSGGKFSGKPGASGKPGGKPAARQGAGRSKNESAAPRKNAERAYGKDPYNRTIKGDYARPTQRARAAARAEAQNRRAAQGESTEGVRLQKVMANAGVASRRACEEMITEGRVEVNAELVVELGARVNPERDVIHVDGMRVQVNTAHKYYVFNKPKHVVSTMEDPEGRRTISDYFKNEHTNQRLYHVGRLDYKTEGLLILTNDGELANRLQHPKYEVPKTYLVQVDGPLAKGVSNKLREGVKLEDGWASVDEFRIIDMTPTRVMVEVTLHSGRNRIVRRMFDAVGHPVQRLVRVSIGPIQLGDQKQGTIRPLGKQEVGHLMAMVGL